jgi:hypothetical protein
MTRIFVKQILIGVYLRSSAAKNSYRFGSLAKIWVM